MERINLDAMFEEVFKRNQDVYKDAVETMDTDNLTRSEIIGKLNGAVLGTSFTIACDLIREYDRQLMEKLPAKTAVEQ